MRKNNTNTGNKRNVLAIAAVLLCIILSITMIGLKGAKEVEARDYAPGTEKMYTTVIIKEGDTLWSIADKYMTAEFTDRESFMDEVRDMNHLTGSIIKTGEVLLVPYYAEPARVASAN